MTGLFLSDHSSTCRAQWYRSRDGLPNMLRYYWDHLTFSVCMWWSDLDLGPISIGGC